MDHLTFNPWRGCTKTSVGCANCYADTLSKRNPGTLGVWGPNGTRVVASEAMWREPLKWERDAAAAARTSSASASSRGTGPIAPRLLREPGRRVRGR
jgi:protein gp37